MTFASQSTLANEPSAGAVMAGCGERSDIAGWLASRFTEYPVIRGLQRDGQLVEVFAAPDGTTWTILVTSPEGRSCIVQEGTVLDIVAPPSAENGPLT